MYYQYTGCIKKGNRTLMCAIGRSQNLTYRNNFCMRSWKDQAFKSVDGFGNSRIRSCSTVPPNVVQSRSSGYAQSIATCMYIHLVTVLRNLTSSC